MGNCVGLFRRRKMRRHIVLILIGLDNAGKTKTVNNLAGEKDDKVLPTVGFKAVNLIHKDTPVTIYDLGGGPQFRQIWSQYYSEVHGVIFVIDSSDFSRLDECKSVLEEVLSHDKISGKPVLVLANKQDKRGALDDIDVVEKLNIEPLVNRYRCPTLVESYSASPYDSKSNKIKIDPGLRKGYQWLLNYIVRRYGDINLRVQTDIHAELERRKRMLNRASNRASQTFTAISDDIATQTGFENPNFEMQKSETEQEKNLDAGLIIVKPIRKPNSIDSTITIESVEESDSSGVRPKLSPLFGRASNTSTSETVKIELEPRSEFRKLSPIVRNKSGVNHIDFKHRPQSSPTHNRKKTSQSSQNSSFQETKNTLFEKNRSLLPDLKHRVLINDVELSQMHREIVLTERVPTAATLPLAARPASASQLVRRQLELCGHKRRLSLRYMQRNKTSPERTSMLIYEPTKVQRSLDKGDFEQSAAIN
ncbi:ADP-ribosylation factor-like protein 13B isoform X2 [Nymphalis io]|uniref:ADP-ribosylation factor-like protein 13B isoform X2 n=1 Tax=Inachis io TaxID=171585 RepID=UPI002168026C|nr:ADP-ribosylation factor-like protein 13B isoform X2 [Nymphalis io]